LRTKEQDTRLILHEHDDDDDVDDDDITWCNNIQSNQVNKTVTEKVPSFVLEYETRGGGR
jgi:hypothetical protein